MQCGHYPAATQVIVHKLKNGIAQLFAVLQGFGVCDEAELLAPTKHGLFVIAGFTGCNGFNFQQHKTGPR